MKSEDIKELRVRIDGLAQLTSSLHSVIIYGVGHVPSQWENVQHLGFTKKEGPSKEIERASESLLLAKAWAGKMLAEIGNENPYGSGYKTKEDIKPTADVAKNLTVDFDGGWEEMNHIERVDYLRTEGC
jgi:hypothetical protein